MASARDAYHCAQDHVITTEDRTFIQQDPNLQARRSWNKKRMTDFFKPLQVFDEYLVMKN